MKFARQFQEALVAEGFPSHWVEKAIPYRQLKKVLGKVREELEKQGYDHDTLQRLLAEHNARYSLEADKFHLLHPELVVRPLPAGAEPSLPLPWAGIKALSSQFPATEAEAEAESGVIRLPGPCLPDGQQQVWVRIPLDSDARFFHILQTDVNELDTLQAEERRTMTDSIEALGNEISEVAKPRKGFINLSKSDLYRWREIFELYLAAQIFFSTNEATGGVRDAKKARNQLIWFQNEVGKRQLSHKFKLESSAAAYSRFMELNAVLLQNVDFQELNQKAVTKIIKKFDKQTSLGVKTVFPKVMNSSTHFIAESIAKDICAQLSRDVLAIVPQTADYTCPICLALNWLPIRLACDHVFCIRCMIKMQNRNQKHCPLCRADNVLNATDINIDVKLMTFLERWFPKETKEKQAYNELERRREMFGELAEDNTAPCCVM